MHYNIRLPIVNPRRACAVRVTVLDLYVSLSVTTFSETMHNGAINSDMRRFVAATALFQKGDFRKTAVFKSYGVKMKGMSSYSNIQRICKLALAYWDRNPLASYPGRVGGEKRPGIHCMRMRIITQNLGDFAYSRKLS